MTGWICLHRGWRDCDVFEDDDTPMSEREAWVWLIENVAWKATRRRNMKGERIEVQRGQFHTSLRTLGDAFNWGKNKVDRFLRKLVDHGMIGTVAGQSGLLITICNYDKYQDVEREDAEDVGTVAGQSRDTQEQGKQTSGDKSPSVDAPARKATRIPEDWEPQRPLPAEVAELVAQWPPGRLERELAGFRDYWLSRQRDAARVDWDRTWWNRIRDQHDRIVRESRNGQRSTAQGLGGQRDFRDGFARALDDALERIRLAKAQRHGVGRAALDC